MQNVAGDVDVDPLGKTDALVCGVFAAFPEDGKCGAAEAQDLGDDLIQVPCLLYNLIDGPVTVLFEHLVSFPDEAVLNIRVSGQIIRGTR